MGVLSGREEPKLGLDGSSTTALIWTTCSAVENVLGQWARATRLPSTSEPRPAQLGTRNIGGAKQALTRVPLRGRTISVRASHRRFRTDQA